MKPSIIRTLAKLAGVGLLLACVGSTQAEIAPNWMKVAPYGDTPATIVNKALSANVVTITTSAPHGYRIGEHVQVLCSPADSVIDTSNYTTYIITTTPSSTTFTYARTAGNILSQASGGVTKRLVLSTNSTNNSMAANTATNHVLVTRGGTITQTPTNDVGVHIFDAVTGNDVGDLSMGPTITNKQLTANVATITTANPHNLTVGRTVIISMNTPDATFDTALNGSATVTGVPTATTFTFAKNAANVGSTAAAGKVNIFCNALGTDTQLAKIRCDAGGGIYACNATLSNVSAGDPFILYYWANEAADPQIIYCNDAADGATVTTPTATGPKMPPTMGAGAGAYRLGESAFDVVSSDASATANVQVYLLKSVQASVGTERFFRFDGTKVAGIPSFTAVNTFSLEGHTGSGIATGATITVDGFGGQVYIGNNGASPANEFARYENDGTGRSPAAIFKSATVANKSMTANIATITTTGPHEFYVGQVVAIRGIDSVFNGSYPIVAVPSISTFTYARNNANVGSVASGGTVTGPDIENASAGATHNVGVLLDNTSANPQGHPMTFNGRKYYIAFEYSSKGTPDASTQDNSALVADITDMTKVRYVDGTAAPDPLPAVTGTTVSGDTSIDNQTARPGNFFIMCKNGQLGSYTVPTLAAPATKKWTGTGGDGRWFTASNWSPAGVPDASSDVVLDHTNVATTYTVQIGGIKSAACRTLTIDAANGNKIATRLSDEGYPMGTSLQSVGTGLSDLAFSGTYRFPLIKDDSMHPRFCVDIFKGTNAITSKTFGNNLATIVTSIANNFVAGDSVLVAANPADPNVDGVHTVISTGANSFSYVSNGTNPTQTITNRVLTSNVATITCSAAHGLVAGSTVTVTLSPSTVYDSVFNGVVTIIATPATSTFTYARLANVTTKTLTANTATLDFPGAQVFTVGSTVNIALVPADPVLNGNGAVITAVTATSISYTTNSADIATTTTGGFVNVASGASGGTVTGGTILTSTAGTSKPNGPDIFRWNNTGSTTVFTVGGVGVFQTNGSGATGLAISGASQTLSDGYSLTFGATTGHLTGDRWLNNPQICMEPLYVVGDGTAANDLVVQNNGYLENYYTGQFSGAPAIINTWGGGNTCFFGPNGNLVHGTSVSYGNAWQSDRVNEYFSSFDGKQTWAPTANAIFDIFSAPANFPSLTRSYDYGNVVCANSFSSLMPTAAYTNTGNAVNFSCNNFTCNPTTSWSGQTNAAGALTVTQKSLAANVATLSFLSQNVQAGDTIVVALSPADPLFDGTRVVTASTLTSVSFASNVTGTVPTALSAGTITKQTGWQYRINGNLVNNGTGLLSQDGQAGATGAVFPAGVKFGGNTTITTSSGTYAFPTAFNVLNGASVTLNTNITVPSGKTAQLAGLVNTGIYSVQGGTSAAAIGRVVGSATGWINGNLKQWVAAATGAYTLPVGTASTAESASISYSAAPSAGGSLAANFNAIGPAPTGLPLNDTDSVVLSDIETAGYWTIAAGDGLTGGTYDVSLTANGFAGPVNTQNNRIVKRTTGGSWTLDGTPGVNVYPVINRTGLTTAQAEFGIARTTPAGIKDALLY